MQGGHGAKCQRPQAKNLTNARRCCVLREKVPDTPLPPLTALSLPRSGMARQFGRYVPQPDDLSLAPSETLRSYLMSILLAEKEPYQH